MDASLNMTSMRRAIVLSFLALALLSTPTSGSVCLSKGQCKVGEECTSSSDCSGGLWCPSACTGSTLRTCSRTSATNITAWRNDLPFNKYAWLTSHNAYAYGTTLTGTLSSFLVCQENSIADQLNEGVRALMLDFYPFNSSIWECHSPKPLCFDAVAFRPAMEDLRAIATWLAANPTEIVTLILEDYTPADGSLTKLLADARLGSLRMPLAEMPATSTTPWPTVGKMVSSGWRLLVFTSDNKKEVTEGIPYVWNYMVENQYGDPGMDEKKCINRVESAALSDTTKSMVIDNWFSSTLPSPDATCTSTLNISTGLAACTVAQSGRWANFVAVDFYKRSLNGQPFKAIDMINGKMLCNCDDINMCQPGKTDKCYSIPRALSEPCDMIDCNAGLTCTALTKVCNGSASVASPPLATSTSPTSGSPPPTSDSTNTVKANANGTPRSNASRPYLAAFSTLVIMAALSLGSP